MSSEGLTSALRVMAEWVGLVIPPKTTHSKMVLRAVKVPVGCLEICSTLASLKALLPCSGSRQPPFSKLLLAKGCRHLVYGSFLTATAFGQCGAETS